MGKARNGGLRLSVRPINGALIGASAQWSVQLAVWKEDPRTIRISLHDARSGVAAHLQGRASLNDLVSALGLFMTV